MVIDLIVGNTNVKAPEVTLGGFLMYHLDSAYFIRAELDHTSCRLNIEGVPTKRNHTSLKLGLGIAF